MAKADDEGDMANIDCEVVKKINTTATLFPFVCGICYEKFNKIDVFYLHLQAHNQNTSDCFHICNDSKNRTQNGSHLNDVRSIFQCGSCLKPFFSICTLHKHMIDVYDIGSYEFDQNSNTAFPKGELHGNNVCLRNEVRLGSDISQADLEAGDNHLGNKAKQESQEIVDSGTSIAHLKEQTLSTRKTRKKIKEKHRSENESKETTRKKPKEELKHENEPKETTVSEMPLRRSRGRPPKPNSTTNSKTKESPNSKIISNTCEVLIKLEESDVKPLRSKALKTAENSKIEKECESKKTKRKNKGKRKAKKEMLNKVKEELITGNIHNDIGADSDKAKACIDKKSSQETANHAEEKGDKYTSINQVYIENDLINVVKIDSERKDIENEMKKTTEVKKVQVRKKKRKNGKDDDGLTLMEKKKLKKYFYTCNICNKTMGLSHKKRHNAIHAAAIEGKPKQDYETCDICGKSIVKSGLKLHQALHSEDRPYLCDRCPKSFKLKSNLHHHKQIHDDFKPHACEACGKRFHRRTDLRFHLRVHSDERPAQCPQCPLRFRKTSTLNIHMKVHRGDKCHQCELCGKAFIRKDYLKRHKVWHSGHPCHECHLCGKKFMEKGGLQRHVKIHSEEKSHICHVCGKGFVLATNMKQHVKNVHSKDKEKKKPGSPVAGENQEQTTDTSNQTEEPAQAAQNYSLMQSYRVILPEENKTEQKKEYHTLMPRVCEFEMAAFPHMGQSSRNYVIPQDFTNVQSSFYTGPPTGIQIPYDSSVMSHIPLPVRQVIEMDSNVTRHGYLDQQHHSVQTANVQYASADNSQGQYIENL